MTNSPYIMIVDDDVFIRKLVEFNVNKAGYTSEVFKNGFAAFQAIQKRRPDCILLDVMMPVMDGFEFLDRFNDVFTDDNRPPVILLTARAQENDAQQARQKGVLHYITKPFVPAELIELIDTVLHPTDE